MNHPPEQDESHTEDQGNYPIQVFTEPLIVSGDRAAMLASVPLAFALRLDAGAVDPKVQRSLRAPVGNTQSQGFEIRNRLVKADQP